MHFELGFELLGTVGAISDLICVVRALGAALELFGCIRASGAVF